MLTLTDQHNLSPTEKITGSEATMSRQTLRDPGKSPNLTW